MKNPMTPPPTTSKRIEKFRTEGNKFSDSAAIWVDGEGYPTNYAGKVLADKINEIIDAIEEEKKK